MHINGPRYIEIVRILVGSAEVTRLIRTRLAAKSTSPKLRSACLSRSLRQHEFDSLILWILLVFAETKSLRSRR